MSPRDLDTFVLLADRVIVICTLSYQYNNNSYIIIIISMLYYDNQFRSEVGGRFMDADEKILREGRYIIRPVTVGSPVGRKSDTFGVQVLTSVCPFIEVTAYIVLKYHIIVIILRSPPDTAVNFEFID